jgi:hypothetical protein
MRSRSPSMVHHLSRWHTTLGAGTLSLALGARAVVNAAFAFWLWDSQPSWSHFFDAAAVYLAVDGAIALLSSFVLGSHVLAESPPLLAPATGCDGILRIVAAVALRAFPGLPDFPVTAVAFLGIVGGCAACLATIAITIRLSVWRVRHREHQHGSLAIHEEMDPVFLAGVVALALVVYAFMAGPPVTVEDYRMLGIRWASTLSVAFAIAALGVATAAHRAARRAAR